MASKPALLLVVLGLLAAGCGGGPENDTPEEALESYLAALADGDAETACELLGPDSSEGSLPQLNCDSEEPAVHPAVQGFADGEVENVVVDGNAATADIVDENGPLTIELVRGDDGWLINGLAVADLQI